MFNTLITPRQLYEHSKKEAWVVLDCRFDLTDSEAGQRAYQKGHLPGAQYADLEQQLSGPVTQDTGRHPLPDPESLIIQFTNWGIGTDSQVLCYDEQSGAFAARLWWLLRWLGHESVAVLEGGWQRWNREGRPTSTSVINPQSIPFRSKPNKNWVLTTREIQEQLDSREFRLLDARAENRYRGKVEPIDAVAGHIPGAINFPFQQNLDTEGNFLSVDTLKAQYQKALQGTDASSTVAMCGSGVTACHTLLAMEVAGLRGGRLYAGSWSEWIQDPARPIAQDP